MNTIDEQLGFIKNRKALLLKEIEMENKILDRLSKELGIARKSRTNDRKGDVYQYTSSNGDYKALQKIKVDLDYYNNLNKLISDIPESNGCRFYEKLNINIAIISDEFMLNYYKDAANFIYVNTKNYKDILGKSDIDLFMFITSWRGLNNEWRGIGSSPNKRKEVLNVIKFAKTKKIPTIFQSIEDPSNYNNFIEIAKQCDYIFTTAVEKVDDYKRDCSSENVYLLEFGVNPLFHNPIGFKNNKFDNHIMFAGSWTDRYKERCIDMEKIFDGVIASNKLLKIIDRNFNFNIKENFFPERYLEYCIPSLNHSDLQKAHKLYDWAINFNSIKYSDTMCAMRVYEMQALGNLIISNYSVAVNNKFPNVFILNDSEEVNYIMSSLSTEDIYRQQLQGIRNVMTSCTVFDRIGLILDKVSSKTVKIERNILVIVNQINMDIVSMFESQTYPFKKIIEKSKLTEEEYLKYDLVCFFSDEIQYLEYYLEDMSNAFKYTNCKYVTKNINEEHNFTSHYSDKFTTVFWRSDFSLQDILSLPDKGNIENGYSIDRFEFVKREDNKSTIIKINRSFYLSVIIPIFNNGNHLLYKCFNSLKRSTIFDKMEIILVDDGSSDLNTKVIVNRLAKEHTNVVTYFFDDNGSGSASRPRNKGIELSTSPYITFLDPDNEAVNDGYAMLYKEIVNSDVDFVIGSVKKITDKETILRLGIESIINSPREYLIDKKFKSQSIQAAVINKKLIADNELNMVVGAIGQDTLFFHELMLCSSRVKIIDELIHIYYGLVRGSAVNKINKGFFEKSLLLEQEAYIRYKKYNVLKNYIEDKFEYFFKHWYLEKFKLVKQSDKEKSYEILKSIFTIYSDDLRFFEKEIKKINQ